MTTRKKVATKKEPVKYPLIKDEQVTRRVLHINAKTQVQLNEPNDGYDELFEMKDGNDGWYGCGVSDMLHNETRADTKLILKLLSEML